MQMPDHVMGESEGGGAPSGQTQHPEAAAGPHDADYLFDRLVRMIGEPANA